MTNTMHLRELPLLGSNQDSPDPESAVSGRFRPAFAGNRGRTAPEAPEQPHENPHGFRHAPLIASPSQAVEMGEV